MDNAKQLLLAEIRAIMQGKNAPDSVTVGAWIISKDGRFFDVSGSHRYEMCADVVPTATLAHALAVLKQRQVAQAEKRIDRLESRKHADQELIQALEKYRQAVD